MSTVNDLMHYLNTHLGLRIPLLPLVGFSAFMVALWKRAVLGWAPAQGLPSKVEIDLAHPEPFVIPMGAGELSVTRASVIISTPGGGSPAPT